MFNRASYPQTPTPVDVVRRLRADGMSRTAIARHLHISPTTFAARIKADPELAAALDEGERAHKQAATSTRTKRRVARLVAGGSKTSAILPDEDAEFETTRPLQPLDEIILSAIEAGTHCDRAAIEKLLNPQKSRDVQITPSLERLLQHGKIAETPPAPGVILTKYELAKDAPAADAEKAG